MGRCPPYFSPESELEIKIQSRQTDAHPISNSPSRHCHHCRPRPPPPPPHQPFKKWFAWLVPTIVVANIVLFVVAMYMNNCPDRSTKCIGTPTLGRFAFQSMRENPLLGPSATTLLKMGALEAKEVVKNHESWRLASSGIGGSLGSVLFIRTTISVGASGALFGLLGAMLSELLVNWTIYENKLQALLNLLIIIIINLSVGILPHVDNFAHLGGFLTGFLLGFILLIRPQYGWVSKRKVPAGYVAPSGKSKYKIYQYIMLIVAMLLLIAGFTVGLVLLLDGVDGNEHCSWCHYLSCFPTPFWTCDEGCLTKQMGNQLNITCLQSHKSKIYILGNGNLTSQFEKLCTDLCT